MLTAASGVDRLRSMISFASCAVLSNRDVSRDTTKSIGVKSSFSMTTLYIAGLLIFGFVIVPPCGCSCVFFAIASPLFRYNPFETDFKRVETLYPLLIKHKLT